LSVNKKTDKENKRGKRKKREGERINAGTKGRTETRSKQPGGRCFSFLLRFQMSILSITATRITKRRTVTSTMA
jgi:hypothetical protein